MAYRAFEPVICVVVFLLVAVGYRSCIATKITSRIARIIKDVSRDILFISTDFALIPMAILIVLLLIAVSYASCITTSIAGCIAGIVKDVSCYVFPFVTY